MSNKEKPVLDSYRTYNSTLNWKPKLSEKEAKKLISKFMEYYPGLATFKVASRSDNANSNNARLQKVQKEGNRR